MTQPVVHVCPHCTDLALTLHACGGVLEATSKHHAMALIRSVHLEQRPLDEVIELLRMLEHAPDLVPPPDEPRTPRSVLHPGVFPPITPV